MRAFFEFLEFLIDETDHSVEVNSDKLKEIWQAFVLKATCVEESNFLFLHLMKSKGEGESASSLSIISSNKPSLVYKELINNYFRNEGMFKISSMNNISYNCFKALFVALNINLGYVKQEKDKLLTLSKDIVGIEFFRQAAFDCLDKEVCPFLTPVGQRRCRQIPHLLVFIVGKKFSISNAAFGHIFCYFCCRSSRANSRR